MKKSYEMDMRSGPLLPKILRFSLPLILSSILQLLFNAADIVVVGRFSGSQSLAAVGSTGSLINLLVNLFIGLSIGANVLVARFYGSSDTENARQTVHTALLTAAIGGLCMIFLGFFLAEPILRWMGTPADVLNQAALYMRVYFIGMPAFMLYNFGAAVLRAVGDTRRPLYFLCISGVVNVLFNLLFVIVFRMGVAGVATATVISQTLSALLILFCLWRSEGVCKLEFRRLRIYRDKLFSMLRIGLPAGLQGVVFNISNVLIQSSVNSFGSVAMAGNTAAGNIEGFVYTSMNAVYQTSLSFTSQNMGAGNYKRIDQVLRRCLIVVAVIGLVMGNGAYLLGGPLLHIYSPDPEVAAYGLSRLSVICVTYFLCGLMDVLVGSIRGMGCSILPTVVSLTGACVFRIVWIFTVFRWQHTLWSLYISYPISWVLTAGAHLVCYLILRRQLERRKTTT
ncbi:MAG: MATE family efflux transporter [Clostridiales bacterium]|nr:MATE family efflux transporter [Clostridiales bacterium]